jgi:hypothetical protein
MLKKFYLIVIQHYRQAKNNSDYKVITYCSDSALSKKFKALRMRFHFKLKIKKLKRQKEA